MSKRSWWRDGTHAPMIAQASSTHYALGKTETENRNRTNLRKLGVKKPETEFPAPRNNSYLMPELFKPSGNRKHTQRQSYKLENRKPENKLEVRKPETEGPPNNS